MSSTPVVRLPDPPEEAPHTLREWARSLIRNLEMTLRGLTAPITQNGYGITGTLTPSRNVDVDSPSTANVAAVLGTLINDLKERGYLENE